VTSFNNADLLLTPLLLVASQELFNVPEVFFRAGRVALSAGVGSKDLGLAARVAANCERKRVAWVCSQPSDRFRFGRASNLTASTSTHS
jgi:hypothetical protein